MRDIVAGLFVDRDQRPERDADRRLDELQHLVVVFHNVRLII